MSLLDHNVWVTKDNRKIPVGKMDNGHLKGAFLHSCRREFDLHRQIVELYDKINMQQKLKNMLLTEANKRKLKLTYPDEATNVSPAEFGDYFKAERKELAMSPEVPKTAVLARDDS